MEIIVSCSPNNYQQQQLAYMFRAVVPRDYVSRNPMKII